MTNQPQSLRGLKALVGIMAVLIVIGTTVVVGTVIHRLYARFTSPPTPVSADVAASQPPPPAIADLYAGKPVELGAGQHITQIASAGAYIAVLVTTPDGEKLLLVDPASGAVRPLLVSH